MPDIHGTKMFLWVNLYNFPYFGIDKPLGFLCIYAIKNHDRNIGDRDGEMIKFSDVEGRCKRDERRLAKKEYQIRRVIEGD